LAHRLIARLPAAEFALLLASVSVACGILTGMWELRLGDEIDDYCVKCRRLTNHSIVSMVETKAAKVRCRTCYSDHDFRNEQAPPSKKELARQKELFNAVLAGVAPAEATAAAAADDDPPGVPEASVDPGAAAAPSKSKKKKT
jgi:hypothetical protein